MQPQKLQINNTNNRTTATYFSTAEMSNQKYQKGKILGIVGAGPSTGRMTFLSFNTRYQSNNGIW